MLLQVWTRLVCAARKEGGRVTLQDHVDRFVAHLTLVRAAEQAREALVAYGDEMYSYGYGKAVRDGKRHTAPSSPAPARCKERIFAVCCEETIGPACALVACSRYPTLRRKKKGG